MEMTKKGIANLLIVGAGDAGQRLARHLALDYRGRYRLVGFIDDDASKQRTRIAGAPVLGGREVLRQLVQELNVDEIVIAIPSAAPEAQRALLDSCISTSARLRVVPSLDEILSGKSSIYQLREITTADVLGRPPAEADLAQCRPHIAGKRVLVVGAAGSVGSELVRHLRSLEPAKLVLADLNESGLFDLEQELIEESTLTSEPCVLDITLSKNVNALFATEAPEVVFHAAAFKHVPLMERYPEEAVRVNVLGTVNVCLAAERYNAERFVFISTDKAVNAVSVMGATKRLGEKIVSSLGRRGATSFCSVRFGNVFGSRGSVVPLFERQIARGGPVTVTNPDMTRYFLALAEAADLVLQASALAAAGEIFILDMGEPVRIDDLARKMIRARGLRIGEDIQIVYSGTRPGEKLHEELLHVHERFEPTAVPGVLRVSPTPTEDWETIKEEIEKLQSAIAASSGNESAYLVETLFGLIRSDGRQDVLPATARVAPKLAP
jgi:FlaA1/EpsC-like NDP-sugar epimerase